MKSVNKLNFFIVIIICFNSVNSYCQSDIDKVLKGGEIIVNGLSFLKGNKSNLTPTSNSKVVESVCIKNKLTDKIIFSLVGKD